MGPSESPTGHSENQEAGRRKRLARRPRMRRCLLKGCAQRFHPRQAHQRYCSQSCREAARKWSRWKAQERYRATARGQQKRNGQSRCYRERVRRQKPPQPEAVSEAARVITKKDFFRAFVRPARLLREIRPPAAKSFAALLFGGVPACVGAGRTAGAALEEGARFNPEILIHLATRLTFSLSDATGVSPARPVLGAPASAPCGTAAAAAGIAVHRGNARQTVPDGYQPVGRPLGGQFGQFLLAAEAVERGCGCG